MIPPKTKLLKLTDIRLDGNTQQRVQINDDIWQEYAESMRCGAKFPPITVFFDGASYWLADGFHRFHAQVAAEFLDAECNVIQGTKRDAQLYSFGANRSHGIRLTNADKNKSVVAMLSDKEWSEWTDEKIAKQCGVSREFVNRLRNKLKVTFQGVIRSQISSESQETRASENQRKQENVAVLSQKPMHETPSESEEPPEENYTELDAANDTIQALQTEIALMFAGTISEHVKEEAAKLIPQLREEIRLLKINLDAVTTSRDILLNENAQMKRQLKMQRKEIERSKNDRREEERKGEDRRMGGAK